MISTIRKVTMVVPVFMTSCQVSEKWNKGPVIPQTTIIIMATANAHLDPSQPEAVAANFPNQSLVVLTFTSNGTVLITFSNCRKCCTRQSPAHGGAQRNYADRLFRSGFTFLSSSTLFFAEYFSLLVFGFLASSGSPALFSRIGFAADLIFSAAALSSSRLRVSFLTASSIPNTFAIAI